MTLAPSAAEDMHVHSTFSDGEGTIEENIAAAEARSLTALTCVDHVRHDTDWHPGFVEEVRRLSGQTELELRCGLEAKLLDTSGALDCPDDLAGADRLYAADHQVPTADGPAHPRFVMEQIGKGELEAADVVEAIIAATIGAVERYGSVIVIAHLFSILPKAGLSEAEVPLESIERLAAATAEAGATVEISERWACPSARTVTCFKEADARVVLSTDSHSPETIGRYQHCVEVVAAVFG